MSLIFRARSGHKHRNVKFVLDWSEGLGFGGLEHRALTAPAIFRRPPTDPLWANDIITAGATNGPADVGVNSATSAGSVTNGGVTMTGLASIEVDELIDPAAPAPPIGTPTISTSSSLQLLSAAGSMPGFAGMGVNTGITRNYVLADSNTTGDSGATITETYSLSYTRPIAGSIGMMAANLATPGLVIAANLNAVNIAGGGGAIAAFAGTGTGGSGTVTQGAETISYSAGISTNGVFVYVSETTPVGALPPEDTSSGTATGVPFPVVANDAMTMFSMNTDAESLGYSYVLSVA